MKRALKWLFGLLLVLGLGWFGVFAAERRAARGSNTLRRELLDLGPTPSPRPLHVREPIDGSTATLFAGLFDPNAPPRIDEVLRATHASHGGLPPGLAIATVGRDSWAGVRSMTQQLSPRIDSIESCLDALALGRDLARGSGLLGITAATQVTEQVLEPCSTVLTRASLERQPEAIEALTQLLDGAPSLARAFREGDLDLQLHTFGRWMREEDLAELPAPIQEAARQGRELPTAFLERQSLLGLWTRMSKTTHAAMDALELPPAERERALEQLEARIETPALSLTAGWRAGIVSHERRLTLLRMLRLATQLTVTQAESGQWPALTEVERGDFTLVEDHGQALLSVRSAPTLLTLTPHPGAP